MDPNKNLARMVEELWLDAEKNLVDRFDDEEERLASKVFFMAGVLKSTAMVQECITLLSEVDASPECLIASLIEYLSDVKAASGEQVKSAHAAAIAEQDSKLH